MPKTSAVQRTLDAIELEISVLKQVRERLAAALEDKPPRPRAPKRAPKHEEPTR